MTPLQTPPLGLYIHLPWCVRKCPYCDFNSHALRGELPAAEYVEALLRDLESEAGEVQGRRVETIFFGGGTPSLFPAHEVQRLLDGVRERVDLAPDAEITLEANPGAVEQARFAGYREAGVNRLSIGVQSFSAEALKVLGRIHDPAEAQRAVEVARAAGFDNFNLDLMYGLPGQDVAGALRDLDAAIALTPTHLSQYQLTLEPNTAFHAAPPPLPDEDQIYDMQLACQTRLAEAGYAQYEVSAYARPGRRCRHNLNYWLFGDYLGIGAGAHGKLSETKSGRILRRAKRKHPRDYVRHAGTAEQYAEERSVEDKERGFEFLMNALRLNEGFDLSLAAARTGMAGAEFERALAPALEQGLLERSGERVRASARGRLFLDAVLQELLPD